MPNQPVKQTEQWPRVALRRELYDKLKKRAAGINTTIADLLALEEREIARRTAVTKAELLAHVSGWMAGSTQAGHIGTLAGLPEPNAHGVLTVTLHVKMRDGKEHALEFRHMGGSIVILAPTFAERNRVMTIPIHRVGGDKE